MAKKSEKNEKQFTKKTLRARGWTHKQIAEAKADGVLKTGGRGRPAFTFSAALVSALESARA